MKAVIAKAGRPESCQPLTCTRDLGDCPVANRPLRELQTEALKAAGCSVGGAGTGKAPLLHLNGAAWVSRLDLELLLAAPVPAFLADTAGNLLAWTTAAGDSTPAAPAGSRLMAGPESICISYPWDLLRVNEIIVGTLTADSIEGEISKCVHIHGHISLGAGSQLLPGVFIEGNAVIGRDCKIGPNCYIRGSTAIGDNCHIGNAVEVKNSILMANVGIGHLSYCGDSIIGQCSNFGAGTITANFRHDGKNHRSSIGSKLVDTGRRKLGVICGDGVHTGINTSIYPGRKIWPGLWTRPGGIVQQDLTRQA